MGWAKRLFPVRFFKTARTFSKMEILGKDLVVFFFLGELSKREFVNDTRE
jgi:hypothetical protein